MEIIKNIMYTFYNLTLFALYKITISLGNYDAV